MPERQGASPADPGAESFIGTIAQGARRPGAKMTVWGDPETARTMADSIGSCTTDGDCPLGSFCSVSNACSSPCVA
jgi:hypothetical protein